MADSMDQDDMATRFREALESEGKHLTKVRSWYDSLTLELL